ncbi:hypothetical protein RCL_jg9375.t1 [Rhizophagus clarus]|uniref:Uncharacterized protein n=1 Tax=Rhizophagus clarus TaxID=94130 RepID=A0A8H3M247_9GLOM|nr:hypothetical protein RCL_jg9375.t1 [Rhizophagus clarus]
MILINVCCCGCIWRPLLWILLGTKRSCALPNNEHLLLEQENSTYEYNNKYENDVISVKLNNEHTDIVPSLNQIEIMKSEKGLFDDDDEGLSRYFERLSKKVEEEFERKLRNGTTIIEQELEKT